MYLVAYFLNGQIELSPTAVVILSCPTCVASPHLYKSQITFSHNDDLRIQTRLLFIKYRNLYLAYLNRTYPKCLKNFHLPYITPSSVLNLRSHCSK